MPTFRIYLDRDHAGHSRALIDKAWPEMRAAAMAAFGVPASVCKLSIIPVENDPDNYPISVEISFLEKPERSRKKTGEICDAAFEAIRSHTGLSPFVGAAMRAPETFVFRK